MDLSTLKPADGAVTRDDLRRGRGHGSGNGKTAGKGHKGRRLVQVLQDLASKVVGCHSSAVFLREALLAEILRTSLLLTFDLNRFEDGADVTVANSYRNRSG